MSPAQIEKKVDDYLHKSQALEDYWQRPITAEQLQAEMDRMAKYSRQPEVLRELFDALGNDPFVIAECLARSALAERLLTNWYSYDQRIHGELKQRAQAELLTHSTFEQIKQISANDGEIEFVKIDRFHEETRRRLEHGVELSPCEWDETMQKLAVTFKKPDAAENYQTIPIGKLSSLQEDESRYYVTVVVKKTGDHLKLATVSWPKERLDSWLAKVENQMPELLTAPDASYRLPIISGGAGCDQSKVFLQFRHGPDHYHVRKLAASSWSIPVE
jgi:hypothetical protein